MPASLEEDGETIIDDRLSDYDCDEDRPNLTSGEAAAIRRAEKNNRKIQTLILMATFFTSLVISSVKWYSSPYDPRHSSWGGWDIYGNGYLDRTNQQRFNQTIKYLLAANISGHDDWLQADEEVTGTLIDLYNASHSPQYRASLWISTIDQRRLNIPDPNTVSDPLSLDDYFFVQRYVLALLFFATGGLQSWTYSLRFLTGSHECYWYDVLFMEGLPLGMGLSFGVQCDGDPDTDYIEDWVIQRMVTEIVMLPNNGMEGTLPMELHHLRYLKELHIDLNPGITGSIPPEYGSLQNLQKLALSYNSIEGNIPASFSSLTRLQQLNLEMNSLVCNTTNGDLDFLKNMKELIYLSLEYNPNMTGTLPDFFSDLSYLRLIALSNNNFAGEIPKSWSSMNNLNYLFLDDNKLSGNVDVLQNMKNLTNLYLQGNSFTGTIDDSFFSKLTNLVHLDLSNNTFDGTLPGHFFNFPELEVLDLSLNRLKGQLPGDFMSPIKSKLKHLALHTNNLTGPIPSTISLSNLTHLDLSSNSLSGNLPSILGNMTKLVYLFLSRNNFTVEQVPYWLNDLTLQELSLKGLNLSGPIPDWIGNLTSLVFLDLGENAFTGELPSSLGQLTKLWILILNDNKLNGTLPSTMAQLRNLEVLLIDDNDLRGNTTEMCNRFDKINYFVADCAANPSEGSPEIQCDCCTLCCKDENVTCNDEEWLGSHESMWENGYSRWSWRFESGSVSPLLGDR